MSTLIRKKAYKARKPEDTIELFRQVLKEKLGITLKEDFFVGDGEFYSCRISIYSNNLEGLDIGTNGKGMTREYALASAYGEFIERLQNLILISNRSLFYKALRTDFDSEFAEKASKSDLWLKYAFAPDELIVHWTMELRNQYSGILAESELLCGDQMYLGKEVALLPYANIMTGETIRLPQQPIAANGTASGMCAGNTPLEAIIQGLDEVLERYVLQRTYMENLSFPTIPDEWFSGTEILRKIKKVEKEKDIRFIIKDCSCGLGIPAIGVLILDNKSLRYTFHLGVDPSLITALERCITETYQGFDGIQWLKIDWELQNRLLDDYQLKETESFKFRQNSTGQLPISIFRNDSVFPLCRQDSTWAISDESDFKKLLALFKDLGRDVYIRDVSFLGIPAYHIYVPGISGLRTAKMLKSSRVAFLNRAILPGKAMDDEDLGMITAMIQYDPFYAPTRYNLDDNWQRTDKDYKLAMLFYTRGEYVDSLRHMELFLSTHSFSEFIQEAYYHSFRNLIWDKVHGSHGLPDLVVFPHFLQISAKVLLENKSYMDAIPSCPKCGICLIKNGCRLFDVFKLVKRIEQCYSENIPSQSSLAQSAYFSDK